MDENQTDNLQEPAKRNFIIRPQEELKYEQNPPFKKSGKKTFLTIGLLVFLILIGGFLFKEFNAFSKIDEIMQSSPAVTSTPISKPSPVQTIEQPILKRSEWSFEILNGSGVAGAAKKMADKIQELGYPVVKVGNAEKDNYAESQILVRAGLEAKIGLVVADLKDIVKIATFAGELKEGTASARIIIGK